MKSLDIHSEYMSYAVELAKNGRGNVSPNPMVGCVIVKDGKGIGEGFHEKFGDCHAEVNALKNCSENPIDSDLYVNLEPCSYFGKTPPCVDEIISNSIKNVYIGSKDPNDKVNGKGIEILKQAGINVFTDILAKECYELNIGFFNWINTSKPWVIAKVAQSKDGFIGKTSSERTIITGPDSRMEVHGLRAKVDAVLIGSNTAKIDNPKLTVRDVSGNNPIRIVLDTFRQLPLNLNIFTDNKSKTITMCSKNNFVKSKTTFCEYLTVDLMKNENEKELNFLDPLNILQVLGEYGITSLMIEGGKKVLDSFMNNNLIDEIHLYTSNRVIGESKLDNPLTIDEDWELLTEKTFENDVLKVLRKKELCLQEL